MSFLPYKKYKDSGVEWLGKVPDHWKVKRLRFMADLNPSKSEIAKLDKNILVSFLPMDAIGDNGSLNLDRERPIAEVETGYTFLRDGDVTVAKITPCFENGKGAVMKSLLNGIGFGTTELIVVRPKVNETESHYLHWLFISAPFRKLGQAHMYGAGGQKRVPDDFVRNFTIAMPDIKEQQTINVFLDRETGKIDALIAEQRNLINLLKEKRKATISHAVTKGLNPDAPMKDSGIECMGEVPEHWRLLRLANIGPLMKANGGNRHDDADVGVPCVRYGDLYTTYDYLLRRVVKYIKYEAEPNYTPIQYGDVLFAASGETFEEIGKSVVNLSKAHACCGGDIIILRPQRNIDPVFLAYVTGSSSAQAQKTLMGKGFTVIHIYSDQLRNLVIATPSEQEQKIIAAKIESVTSRIDLLIAETQQNIDLLKERRTALISAAVTGKIDVREMN